MVTKVNQSTSNTTQWLTAFLFCSGTQYTLSMWMAASEGIFNGWGGDTNGNTDVLCVTDCALFPFNTCDYKGNLLQILASGGPEGGLQGNGPWKRFSLTFTPTSNCPAIMIGASASQTTATTPTGLRGTYNMYDALNLQETRMATGQCDSSNVCVPI